MLRRLRSTPLTVAEGCAREVDAALQAATGEEEVGVEHHPGKGGGVERAALEPGAVKGVAGPSHPGKGAVQEVKIGGAGVEGLVLEADVFDPARQRLALVIAGKIVGADGDRKLIVDIVIHGAAYRT